MRNFLFSGEYFPFNSSKVLFILTGSDKQRSPRFPVVSDEMRKGKGKGKFSLLPSLLWGVHFATPAPQKDLGEWPQDLQRTPRAACQRILKYPPKYDSPSPKRIPQNHPRDPYASSQNPTPSPKGPVSIPQRIPEYFPRRSVTSAAERRAGPGFPSGSGRSSPSSAAGIPHPLQTQGPGWMQRPAPWGEDGSREHPRVHMLGSREPRGIPGSHRRGIQGPNRMPIIRGWPLLGDGGPGMAPAAPTHLRLLQIRARSSPGVSAGIFHSQAARNPQTLRTSQPRNLQGTYGDILAGGTFPGRAEPPRLSLCQIQGISPHFTAGNVETPVD